jgi:hypothetical protein
MLQDGSAVTSLGASAHLGFANEHIRSRSPLEAKERLAPSRTGSHDGIITIL